MNANRREKKSVKSLIGDYLELGNIGTEAIRGIAAGASDAALGVGKLDRALDPFLKDLRTAAKVAGESAASTKRHGRESLDAAEKLRRLTQRQESTNLVMKQAGVSARAAGQVARAYGKDLDRLGDEALEAARKLDAAQKETKELTAAQRGGGRSSSFFAKGVAAAGVAVLGALGGFLALQRVMRGFTELAQFAGRSFIDLENAVVGLRKVTDLGDAGLENFTDRLETLSSTTVPVATAELIDLAAVAGQLGVETASGLEAAAVTAAQLAQATDLTGEAALKSLAQILGVQGESIQSIDELGSALTALGNKTRDTESAILPLASEISRSTATFKIGSQNVLGFAAALADMNAKAEGSGSALAELFQALVKASVTGEKLKELAAVAGITAGELRGLVESDLTEASVVFLEGLSRFGKESSIALESVGLSSKRTAKALGPLAENTERLREQLERSNRAFEENTALGEEAGRAFDRLEADIQRTRNAAALLAAKGFGVLAPIMSGLLKDTAEMIRLWQATAEGLAEIPVVAAPAALVLGVLDEKIQSMITPLQQLPRLLGVLGSVSLDQLAKSLELLGALPGVAGAPFAVAAQEVRDLQAQFLALAAIDLSKPIGDAGDAAAGTADDLGDLGDAADKTKKSLAELLSEAGTRLEGIEVTSRDFDPLLEKQAELNRLIQELPVEKLATLGDLAAALATDLERFDRQRAAVLAVLDSIEEITEKEAERLAIETAIADLFESGKIDKGMADQLKVANGIADESGKILDTWLNLADAIAGAFGDFDGQIGNLIKGMAGLVDQVEQLEKLRESEPGRGQVALAGFGIGQQAGGIISGLGISTGRGQAGGVLSGLFGAGGELLSTATGIPGLGILGGVLGEFIGGLDLFASGGDDVIFALENMSATGFELGATFQKVEGQMKPLGDALAKAVIGGFNAVVAAAGGIVTGIEGQVRLKARETEEGTSFRVILGREVGEGGMGATTLFETLDEGAAVARTIVETLKRAEISGLSERFQTALASTTASTVEELQRLVVAVAEVDAAVAGTGPITELFRALRADLSVLRTTLAEAGLAASDFILVENKRIAAIRQGIKDTTDSIIGVQNVAAGLQALKQSFLDFNAEVEKTRAARQAELEAVRAQAAEFDAAQQELGSGTGALGDFRGELGVFMTGGREDLDGFGEAMGDFRGGIGRTRIDVEALEAAFDELPEALDLQEVMDAATVAAASFGVGLIDTLRQISGDQQLLEEERAELIRIQNAITVGAQIGQLQLLIAMTDLLDEATRGLLQTVVDVGLEFLEDLLAGTDGAGEGPTAGGRRLGAGGSARRQEAEATAAALADFREQAALLRQEVGGASEATLAWEATVRSWSERAMEAKASSEELNAVLRDLAALAAVELAEPFKEAARQLRETDLATTIRTLVADAAAAIDQARTLAGSAPGAAAGAERRIETALRRQLVEAGRKELDVLGGAARKLRREGRETVKTIEDLVLNMDALNLTAGQIARTVTAGIMPQLLDVAIAQAERVGDEERAADLRARRAQIETDLLLLQVTIWENTLAAAGAISDEIRALIDGIREDVAQADFEAPSVVAAAAVGRIAPGAGGAATFTADDITNASRLAEQIRAFIDGFAGVGAGPLTAQAREWLAAVTDFEEELLGVLTPEVSTNILAAAGGIGIVADAVAELTADELGLVRDRLADLVAQGSTSFQNELDAVEATIAAGGLGAALAAGAQSLLDQFGSSLVSSLSPLEQLTAEYDDLTTALMELGQLDQLAAAADLFGQRLKVLDEQLKEGFEERILERRREDPTVTNLQRFQQSQTLFETLVATSLDESRTAAERSAAVGQLLEAEQDFRDQIASFLGGATGTQELLASNLAALEAVQASDILGADALLSGQDALVAAMGAEGAIAQALQGPVVDELVLIAENQALAAAALETFVAGDAVATDGEDAWRADVLTAFDRLEAKLVSLEAQVGQADSNRADGDVAKLNAMDEAQETRVAIQGNTRETADGVAGQEEPAG